MIAPQVFPSSLTRCEDGISLPSCVIGSAVNASAEMVDAVNRSVFDSLVWSEPRGAWK